MLPWVAMFLRSRRSWLLGTALFVVGCLSPTLPLPPPSDPLVTSTDTAGLVRLTGSVEPESQVFAWNRSTDSIRGQFTKSGIYDFTIEAQERDSVTFWYIHGTVESPSAEIVIKLESQPAP
jgi:hypothetical protein